MYKRSVRRAYSGISPHLWPFAAWRMLVTWAAVVIAGTLGAAFVAGEDLSPLGVVLVTPIYVLLLAFYLLIPAALITLFDLALVDRPRHRPKKFNIRPRRTDRQQFTAWAGWAATVSTIFGLGYLFVYLNAFAPAQSYLRLIEMNLLRFAVGGAGAGLIVAWLLNTTHDRVPAQETADHLRRGAFMWAATVIGFAAVAIFYTDSTLEQTLLPGALLAVIGAAVIPQLAVTPPMDLSQNPPPEIPSAPSPGPTQDPEGGAGEGARGDWRTAPPPKFPPSQTTRSNPDSITTTMEVVNG